MKLKSEVTGLAALGAIALFSAHTVAAPVDLSTWQQDGSGDWVVSDGVEQNDTVKQTLNSRPTVFFNNENSQGKSLAGRFEVQTRTDDDFFGFVLGYNQGDIFGSNPATNYILVDWKQGTQGGWDEGLAISRVSGSIDAGGTDTGADAWDHVNNVSPLGRGATLGDTGWGDNTSYLFDILFTDSNIQVAVDGEQQFDVDGSFQDGSFGFYNFSQPDVLYAGITEDVVPEPDPGTDPGTDPNPVPNPSPSQVTGPGGLGLMVLALLTLGLSRRRS